MSSGPARTDAARPEDRRGLSIRTQLTAAAVLGLWLVFSFTFDLGWQLDFLVIGFIGVVVNALDNRGRGTW